MAKPFLSRLAQVVLLSTCASGCLTQGGPPPLPPPPSLEGPPPDRMQMPLEIIGDKDDREPVPFTKKRPWSMQGHLVMTFNHNSIVRTRDGSGTMIGPRHVLTAAHNVHRKDYGRAVSTTFYPGQNSDELPFDSAKVLTYKIAPRWLQTFDPTWDFAVLVLDSPIGKKTGHMSVAAMSDEKLTTQRLTLAGYPKERGSTLWSHSGRLRGVSPDFLLYDLDTEEGQSGSCLFISSEDAYTVVGIHTLGDKAGNSGVRINDERAKLIGSWL